MLLPINEKPYYNTDQIANSISANEMFDCYLEPVPGVGLVTRRRPGLIEFANLGSGFAGQGIFEWEAAGIVLAVSNGVIYQLDRYGNSTALSGETLHTSNPVVFADGQKTDGTPWLYLANGKLIYTTDGLTTATPTDINTPSTATHVAWIDSRFIANQPNSNRFIFTDTDPATSTIENDYWSSTDNPVTCDARGDQLSALFTAWQEIYAWGSQGLQIFQDDGVTPFSNIPGGFSEIGIEAVNSIKRLDNTIFALCVVDGKRVVVKFQGRSPQIVSEPVATVLAGMDTVSDAIGDIISVGGLAIYLLSFPSGQQTWAYDFKNDTWCRWGYYYGDADDRERFIGQHSCYVKAWNKHLIMSRLDGKIYELSRSAFDDAGTLCIPYRRTGHTDAGIPGARKQCNSLYLTGKPGLNADAKLMMRWRDDGTQAWSNYLELSFDKNMVEPLNRMGTFRTRQYEFRIPAGMDTVLISADGEFRGLRN